MSVGDEIWDLIHSLSPSEKRYFRLASQRHRGKPLSLRLFEAFEAMPAYSEESLRDAMKGEKALRQLGVAQNALLEALLRTLTDFHKGKSTVGNLRDMLSQIEWLNKRGAYALAAKKVRQAWKKASLFQLPLTQMELMHWRMRFARQQGRKNLPALLEEQRAVAREIQIESELRLRYDEVFALVQQFGPGGGTAHKTQIDRFLAHPNVAEPPTTYFDAAVVRHYIFVWAAVALGEYDKVEARYRELIALWQQHPHQIKDRPEAWVSLLFTHLDACLQAANFEGYAQSLEWVRQAERLPGTDNARILYQRRHLEIRYQYEKGERDVAMEMVQEIGEELTQSQVPWGASGELTFFHNIAALCMKFGAYREALPWIRRVVDHPRIEIRMDLQQAAGLYNIIVQFEQGNYSLLDFLIRGKLRAGKPGNVEGRFGRVFLKGMKHLLMQPVAEWPACFETLSADLAGFDIKPEWEPVLSWVEGKKSSAKTF